MPDAVMSIKKELDKLSRLSFKKPKPTSLNIHNRKLIHKPKFMSKFKSMMKGKSKPKSKPKSKLKSKLKSKTKLKSLKGSKKYQFETLEKQEEDILKEFNRLENALKNVRINKTNQLEETRNIQPSGEVEKSIVQTFPDKKIRRKFKGCAIQTKTILYENKNDKIDKNEYFELKKIYRQCPKNVPTTED